MRVQTKFVRRIIPNSEALKLFPVGSLVSHKTYGEGRVLRISNGFIYVIFKSTGVIGLNLNPIVARNSLTRIEPGKNNRNYCITRIRLHCNGLFSGEYYVIRYISKLKKVANKYLIPLNLKIEYKNSWTKTVRVYLDVDKKLIYIKNNLFLKYKEHLVNGDNLALVDLDR